MKKVLKNVSFVFLLLKVCIILGQETSDQKRIVIDVGHGGKDSGAIGINGIREKDVVMKIALEILRINKQAKMPFDIYLTRYGDTLISLSDRTKLAKALKADLFVSLHCNHSNNPNARGVEVHASNKEGESIKESIWFAFQLQEALNNKLGFMIRGVKFSNFQVLRVMTNNCISILVEIGFLTNREELQYLSLKKGREYIAYSIWETISKN